MRKYLGILSLFTALAAAASAQTSARIVYTFEHPQLNPSKYSITIDESGAGHFSSQPGLANIDYQDGVFPSPVERDIHLDQKLRSDLFDYARTHSFFKDHCDRGRGGLAFTGNKTLAYTGSDGQGTCTFVWAADPVLQRLSDQLNAVAFTIEVGRRLEVEVRHDRLGLDSELQGLQDALKDQRASDLPNIASDLQAIAEDQQVMDRARKRALSLLSRCENPEKRN
ncbi:MAG TPA: hypothetical protein VJS11_13465 [Acidobacteriaceae bacterium]|nr:hypothetical protein [Acidobacteriaceae bacterium]